jgi:antitoxin component of RelBE/YafQ-DinJ toxin-antitoxin module
VIWYDRETLPIDIFFKHSEIDRRRLSYQLMAQYKHDRFFKFYVQALYKTKGETLKNIQVRNDEDLEIDCMFVSQPDKIGWQQEDLGLFDRLMKKHPTIIVEHYSGYLNQKNLNVSITRKNLYWEPKEVELIESARVTLQLKKSEQLPQEAREQIEIQNPFTWILAVNCGDKLLNLCEAKALAEYGTGVYELSQLLRMGIVVIDRLADAEDTLWLKMLGDKDTARRAFGEIERLSPERREKNDIIRTSLKYCVYLRGLPTESLTAEEREFMRTMEQVDAWYDAEIAKAEQKAQERKQQEIALRMFRENISLDVIERVTGLTIEQLQAIQSQLETN